MPSDGYTQRQTYAWQREQTLFLLESLQLKERVSESLTLQRIVAAGKSLCQINSHIVNITPPRST